MEGKALGPGPHGPKLVFELPGEIGEFKNKNGA